MKLSVSAYRAHASAHKKILASGYHSQYNYGSTGAASSSTSNSYRTDFEESINKFSQSITRMESNSDTDVISPAGTSSSGQEQIEPALISSESKSPSQRKSCNGDGASDPESDWNKSNQRWMKLRTTVQISSAIQKKPPLKREDSFLKRFSTRQLPETQETVEDTGSESVSGEVDKGAKRRKRYLKKRRSVINPDENFHFYWLMMLTICVLYNLWTLIVRQSFPELQKSVPTLWLSCDVLTDAFFIFDIVVQLRTGYLEQGLMVYDDKKLAFHYMNSRAFIFDITALIPLDLLQLKMGAQPLLRFTRFLKVYRTVKFYYIVESRTVWPNLWRVINLIHILLILAHWFGCFYYLLSEAEGFQGEWVYPYRPGDYATLSRKYLGSLYWSTLTLTTIGDLPTPETNAEYLFTIVSYLIGVFIFATIVGQVGNVITNRNANRLEFERLLDGAKTYMRHHKVPGGMKRRVLRWYDYSWSRGRIQGGGDINTALGLLPDKLKTELALHVNLSVLKKVTIFQECQPEFLHDLVLKMKAYIFTPGDSICRKGEVAREMFIIADGILEVISETGKVLTTMKAGDFFGEIGILNLDGLNKRTADVRSVGYSELFSLSREDVLSAMKDYPEAQEILQTLGRKRLMEVRCVNKKFAKDQSEKKALAAQNQFHHIAQSDSSENSTSKKMVDKLRNDVKGFKSALKKSRTSRKSIESLEMEPLNSISPKTGKTMLKRMPRVKSDEKSEPADIEKQHEKTPSTIGAGLPLLQRLRLLKEKQDREERAVKSVAPLKSPPHPHVTCTLSPQESIQEEPEKELNEGLPLVQRIQQNQSKTDVLNEDISVVNKALPSNKTESATPHMGLNNNNYNGSTSLTVAPIKPTMKVSFKQRMQQLQSTRQWKSSRQANKLIDDENINIKKEPPKTLSVTPYEPSEIALQNIYPSVTKKILKPSMIMSPSISEADTPIKPWSKLKLATLISSSNTSLENCSAGDFRTPIKNYSVGNIPTTMSIEKEKLIRKSSKQKASSVTALQHGNTLQPFSSSVNKPKFYNSVFDLSPEYSGLPFVKRLKILNERQKLAELETVLQTRSSSLDCSKKQDQIPLSESLYRCFSDTSGIYSQFVSTHESSSTTSTNTSTSESSQRTPTAKNELQNEYTPLNPELNETCVKKQLKSILKNQPKDSNTLSSHLELRQSERLNTEPRLLGTPNSSTYSFVENKDHHIRDDFKSADSLDSNTPTTSSYLSQQFFKTPCDSPECAFMISEKNFNISLDTPAENIQDIEGKTKSQDFFHQMLFGINNAVTSHMNEIHSKLELQFSIMQNEVKKRDDIITNLQNKLRNLELKAISIKTRRREKAEAFSDDEGLKSDENNSESSGELLFMRGDSLDTVFTSSPPIQVDCTTSTPGTSRYHSTNTYFTSYKNKSAISAKDSEGNRMLKSPCSEIRDYKVTDSAILDVEDSSSSSTSSSKSNLVAEDNSEKAMHHNDWELRMLAAELEKQERRRGNSLCDNPKNLKDCSAILKRRRKISNSESECSETGINENLVTKRNRAASLDQFNTVYEHGNGIFETIGTDRDKNKL